MDAKKIQQLLELIEQVVNGHEPYVEKKAAVEAEASDDQMIALSEFCGWWE